MRIAIVGNSHLACLRRALAAGLFDPGGVEIVFFGQAGPGFGDLSFADGCLHLPDREFVLKITEGRYERLPVAEFDALAFHGGVDVLPLALTALAHAGFDPAAASAAVLDMVACEWLRARVPYAAARAACAAAAGPVVLSGTPRLAVASAKYDRTAVTSADPLAAAFRRRFAADGFDHLPQPPGTVTPDGLYSRTEWTVATEDFGEDPLHANRAGDHLHMNRDYGALILRALFERVALRRAA